MARFAEIEARWIADVSKAGRLNFVDQQFYFVAQGLEHCHHKNGKKSKVKKVLYDISVILTVISEKLFIKIKNIKFEKNIAIKIKAIGVTK